MATQYIQNISIAGLTLTLNPDQYEQKFKKYGSYKRTIGGGIVEVDVNSSKLTIDIKGVTQDQVETIKKYCSLNKIIEFIDYVPIAEKNQQTRAVQEDLGSEIIDGETIYLYIPKYYIMIFDFSTRYADNVMSYEILGEEV